MGIPVPVKPVRNKANEPACVWKPRSLIRPSYDDVVRAAERIEGVAHKTPVHTSKGANELAGAELFFKCENYQRGGAFKFRGAYNAVAALSLQQRRRGVVTYSSGNHAQAFPMRANCWALK